MSELKPGDPQYGVDEPVEKTKWVDPKTLPKGPTIEEYNWGFMNPDKIKKFNDRRKQSRPPEGVSVEDRQLHKYGRKRVISVKDM